jgi:probable blue pigment (indigoidine) exporter
MVLQERIRPLTVAAAAVGAGGVALVVLGPAAELDLWGVLAALGGVTATAFGMILTKRWGRPPGVGPTAYAGWQLTAGGLLLLPVTLGVEGVPSAIDAGAAVGYLWLGTVGGIVAYTLWFRGIQQLPVIAPGLLALLSPIVATILGVLIAGEHLTAVQTIGLALTIGALVVGQLSARPAPGRLMPPTAPTSMAAAPVAPR